MTSVKVSYENNGTIAKAEITTDADIDFTNEYFSIDIIDMIKANNYYKTNENSDYYNDEETAHILNINKNNVNNYISSNYNTTINKGGISLFASSDNHTLTIYFLKQATLYNGFQPIGLIGFNSIKVIVGFNAYNELEKNKAEIIEFNINLSPSIIFGDIQKLDVSAEDPTIPTDASRCEYDFGEPQYKDNMYVNTSAGTNPTVPYYIVDSSAYMPEICCNPASENYLEYDWENMKSRLTDPNDKNNYINIPYEFLSAGVDHTTTAIAVGGLRALIKEKVWVIRQTISTSAKDTVFAGDLTLEVNV